MSKSPEFNEGDIVVLKSGGPEMTISDKSRIGGELRYYCRWFAGKKLEDGRFGQESIKHAPKNEK